MTLEITLTQTVTQRVQYIWLYSFTGDGPMSSASSTAGFLLAIEQATFLLFIIR